MKTNISGKLRKKEKMDERKESQDVRNYKFGGFKVRPVTLLRLISELEGSYQLLKYMGFKEDMETMEEMKSRYYKLYFKKVKEEKLNNNQG